MSLPFIRGTRLAHITEKTVWSDPTEKATLQDFILNSSRRCAIVRIDRTRAISSTMDIYRDLFFTWGSMLTLKRRLTRLPFSISSFVACVELSDARAVQIGLILSRATFDGIAKAYPPTGGIGQPNGKQGGGVYSVTPFAGALALGSAIGTMPKDERPSNQRPVSGTCRGDCLPRGRRLQPYSARPAQRRLRPAARYVRAGSRGQVFPQRYKSDR